MYKEPDTGMEKIMLYTVVFFTLWHLFYALWISVFAFLCDCVLNVFVECMQRVLNVCLLSVCDF